MSRRNRGHTSPRQHNNCQSRGAGGLVIKGLIYIPAQTYSPHRLFARMCLCASCQLQGDGSCCCSWMQKKKEKHRCLQAAAYDWLETAHHLLQTTLLFLEIRFETVEEHGYVLEVAICLHLSFSGFAEPTVHRIAGLEHHHRPIELETQKSGRPLFPFQPIGADLLLHLSAFLRPTNSPHVHFRAIYLSLFSFLCVFADPGTQRKVNHH